MASTYACKAWIRNLIARAGLRRRKRKDATARLLEQYGVQVVFDVGANAGQYARRLRAMSYRGRIVSFEPLADALGRLRANARGDRRWQVVPIALGARDGQAEIHVAGNSQSSSLLPMLPSHVAAHPASAYVGTQAVTLRRLDGLIDTYCAPGERAYLKLDVQGAERDVLEGAGERIEQFAGVQLEMSLVPLYEREMLFEEAIRRMRERGFVLMSLAGGLVDPRTGRQLQVDGVFYRSELVECAPRQRAAA